MKHFLKRDTNSSGTAIASTISTGSNNTFFEDEYRQRMTGARPKIPVNTSLDVKMKRSPKFSSFDSQASLAEFSSASSSTSLPTTSMDTANDSIAAQVYRSGGGCTANQQNHQEYQRKSQQYNDEKDKTSFQRSFSTFDIGGGGRRYTNSGSHNSPTRLNFDEKIRTADNPVTSSSRPLDTTGGTLFSKPIVSPDISSALPDFVQDHILVEHFYNNYTPNISPHSVKYDQLPDFTITENESRLQNSGAINGDNMPFDLMCNSSSVNNNRHSDQRRNLLILPLDLPPSVGNQQADDDVPVNRQRSPRQNSTNDIPLDLTARNDHFTNRQNRSDGHLSKLIIC